MRSMTIFSAAAIAFAISGHASATDAASGLAAKSQITFHADTAYPESITWSDRQGKFFIGSVRHGVVGTVTPDGTYTPFITDPELISTAGVLADDASNTLWVANEDAGSSERTNPATKRKLAGVGKYDETTGRKLAYYDLGSLYPGAHFANDIAIDASGNAFVTDSFSPVIYRIGADGKTLIYAQRREFNVGAGFNLNGIVYHKGDYLLVGNSLSGEIFKVSTKHPDQVTAVRLEAPIKGLDGFRLLDASHLIVVVNAGRDKIVELESKDGWKTAKIVREARSLRPMPTAAAHVGHHMWVLNAELSSLSDPKAPKVSDYILQKF